MRVFVAFLFLGMVGVHCIPGLKLFGKKIPVITKIGNDKNSQEIDISLLNGDETLAINHNQKTKTEDVDHEEEQTRQSNENFIAGDDRSHYVSRDDSGTDMSRDTSKVTENSRDFGLRLDKGGLDIFEKKKKSDERKMKENMSGFNNSMCEDITDNSGHFEDRGSRYNRTSEVLDRNDEYENRGLSFGKGRSLFAREKGTAASHDRVDHEDGNSWEHIKDYLDSEDSREVSSLDKTSDYTKDSAYSISNKTLEQELEIGDEEGALLANAGHYEASGKHLNKTAETRNDNSDFEREKLSFGEGRYAFDRERESIASHDELAHEDGSDWDLSKDYFNTENETYAADSNRTLKYSKDDNLSSVNTTLEKEGEEVEVTYLIDVGTIEVHPADTVTESKNDTNDIE